MRRELVYEAANDRWICKVEKIMDAVSCAKVGAALLKAQQDALAVETDPVKRVYLGKSICALVEGRIYQTMGAEAPALIGR